MKILLVSSYLPYPLLDGGRIRLYNLLKFLKDKHEITLICEKWPAQTNADIAEVSKVCHKAVAIERPKTWSIKNVLKTAMSLNPFLLTVHTNKKITEEVEKEMDDQKFDLIHVETFYVMQNLPKVNIPIVLVEHNIEYLVYGRYAKNAPIFLKPFLYIDILKLKRKEKKFWKKANRLVAVSPREQKIMGSDAQIIPNGVNIDKFRIKKIEKSKKEKKILFIGNFKWVQNRDSIAFIIRNIWPRVISENKGKFDLKLWVVGKNIPEGIKNLGKDSVIFDENATSETELIFQGADLLLAPIRVGGGSNFKILESMSSGTPVLTTNLGNEGINAKDGEEIIICEKPEEFVGKILTLISDDYLYEKLSRNGRKFIEENFDWRNISQKLDRLYQDVVQNP